VVPLPRFAGEDPLGMPMLGDWLEEGLEAVCG
jgi:hypothetical protein